MKPKTEQLNIRIDKKLRIQLERLAKEQDLPLSFIIRKALKELVTKKEKP
jgi:predicted transcriptional regulator